MTRNTIFFTGRLIMPRRSNILYGLVCRTKLKDKKHQIPSAEKALAPRLTMQLPAIFGVLHGRRSLRSCQAGMESLALAGDETLFGQEAECGL
jgi:hypothetical protein